MIRALLLPLALCAAIIAGEAALPPHQGTVVLDSRSFAGVWIISETTDGVVHTLDEKRDSPPTNLARNRYVRVDYETPKEVNWLRGDAKAAGGRGTESVGSNRPRTPDPAQVALARAYQQQFRIRPDLLQCQLQQRRQAVLAGGLGHSEHPQRVLQLRRKPIHFAPR